MVLATARAMKEAYKDECLSERTIFRWHSFSESRESAELYKDYSWKYEHCSCGKLIPPKDRGTISHFTTEPPANPQTVFKYAPYLFVLNTTSKNSRRQWMRKCIENKGLYFEKELYLIVIAINTVKKSIHIL